MQLSSFGSNIQDKVVFQTSEFCYEVVFIFGFLFAASLIVVYGILPKRKVGFTGKDTGIKELIKLGSLASSSSRVPVHRHRNCRTDGLWDLIDYASFGTGMAKVKCCHFFAQSQTTMSLEIPYHSTYSSVHASFTTYTRETWRPYCPQALMVRHFSTCTEAFLSSIFMESFDDWI